MNVQYLSDAQGRHTAIVIPIEEWNILTAKHEDLKDLENSKQKLSEKYAGKLPAALTEELQHYINQDRSYRMNKQQYLIDTNAVIDYLGPKLPASVWIL